MNKSARILVVDDTPMNVKLLADVLRYEGYQVVTAAGGKEGLAKVDSEKPDLVLLDVMMPDLDGYAVCRAIRANPETAILPVVMVTALNPADERVKGLEAGADDFLSKPVNEPELLARVRSLLRIKEFHDQVQAQARELAEWNRTLEQRVAEGVHQIEQVGRLKRFLSPQIADLIVSGNLGNTTEDLLKSHRREITVVFLDLRGFTAFTETADPEEVMGVLQEYHNAMGRLIMEHNGTIQHFAGDGIMICFNDPVPIENPAKEAVQHGDQYASRLHPAGAGVEEARLRPAPGDRHRPGICDFGNDRLRRSPRLQRDRLGLQPRQPALQRGRGRPDSGAAEGLQFRRGPGDGRAGGRTQPQGISQTGAGVQRDGAYSRLSQRSA